MPHKKQFKKNNIKYFFSLIFEKHSQNKNKSYIQIDKTNYFILKFTLAFTITLPITLPTLTIYINI